MVVIGAAAGVAVLLLWYLLFWGPQNRALKEARKRRQTAEQQESQLRTEITRLRSAQREEQARRARLEALRTAIPDEPNLAQFIIDANNAAARSGIDFISVAPQVPAAAAPPMGGPAPAAPAGGTPPPPGPQGAAPAEVKLNLQIRGGYFQVLDFMNRLDDLPRLVVNDGVSITADQTGRLTVGLTARMFTRSLPAGFATTAPGGAPPAGGAPATTAPTAPAQPGR